MGITTCRLEGPVDFYSVGQFVSGPGWRHLRRTIDTFELMFVRRGVLPMRVGEQTLHIEAGQIALLPPNVEHAGADIITFHCEASKHIDRTLQLIRERGAKAGLVFNPATPLSYLDHVMDRLDLVLLMSVNPGFGGQSFIPSTLEKVRMVKERFDRYEAETGRRIMIEVDGGIKAGNIADVAAAGADTFVAGSAVFGAGSKEGYRDVINAMRANVAALG